MAHQDPGSSLAAPGRAHRVHLYSTVMYAAALSIDGPMPTSRIALPLALNACGAPRAQVPLRIGGSVTRLSARAGLSCAYEIRKFLNDNVVQRYRGAGEFPALYYLN